MRNSYGCIYNCLFCFKLEILFKIRFFSCVCVGLSTVQKALGCHHSRKDFVQLGDNSSTIDVQVHFPPLLYYVGSEAVCFPEGGFSVQGELLIGQA